MYIAIQTDRLLLRPLKAEDFYTTHAYSADRENTRHMVFLPFASEEETRDFLRKVEADWAAEFPSDYEFAIEFEGVHIGHVGVSVDEERREGEIGWILGKRYWHQGLATEAAIGLRDFCFGQLGLTRLTARCDAANESSVRLMERIGMVPESVTPGRYNRGAAEPCLEKHYISKRPASN